MRNTFLCVKESSDEAEEEQPVRHIQSEPVGNRRQLAGFPRTVSSAPADYFSAADFFDDCDPITLEGESTVSEEGEPTAASGYENGTVLEEEEAEQEAAIEEERRAEEPVSPDAAPRAAEVRTARPCADPLAAQEHSASVRAPVATMPQYTNPVPMAAFTAPTHVVQFSGMLGLGQPLQPALWPLGHVAMAASATQAPDTQAGDVARGSQDQGGQRDAAPLQATTAVAKAPVPQGVASTQSQALSGSDRAHVYWTVNARKIHSKETKVASPRFCIFLPSGPCPFQLMLYAEARSPRWGSSGFARARGRGRIELRCGAELPSGSGRITFSLSLGEQTPRPPVSHDFSQQSCCGLRRWDFSSAVDPSTGTFVVHLEIVALGPFEGPSAPSSSVAQGRHGGA